MKELNDMGRLTFYIDSKMKYTTPSRPGDTKSLNDGKRAAISLNPVVFTDARLLYTIVAHELVHARDILNTNYLQWQFDYIYQSTANDIMEHHAYQRSAAIEAGFGVDYGSAGALQILGPKLPAGFSFDLYNK
jgi:hypothetical protein